MIKKEIGKIFPNLHRNIAYYSPISQFVTLNEIEEGDLPSLFNSDRDMITVKKASVYLHESRHNIDHLGTLWGQYNILKLSNAIEARLSKDENNFHKILPLKIEENQFHYDEYYTEYYSSTNFEGVNDIWVWRLSSGIKFDIYGHPNENAPIPFIRFSKRTSEPVVRTPLSIAALLETNALYDELKHVTDHINDLPAMEREIENSILTDYIFRNVVYNQYMANYNSIVHLTANILKIKDLMVALKISSSIATVALNLPKGIIVKIPINSTAEEHWGERNKAMINNNEYGYIFYLLVTNYQVVYKETQVYSTEKLLEANYLPKINDIMTIVANEFDIIKSDLSKNACLKSYFENNLNKGKDLFNKRGLDGAILSTESIIKNNFFKPDVICSDTDFDLVEFNLEEVSRNPPDNMHFIERYSFADLINSRFDEFFRIRGL